MAARKNWKKGLRVKYCESVGRCDKHAGMAKRIVERSPDAWYIQVCICAKWRALMNLPFQREKDALRAVHALTAAGLDSATAMERAGPMAVKQVACEFLQW
jgi:hypothetical protein